MLNGEFGVAVSSRPVPTPGPRSVPLTMASGANGATCPDGGVGAERNVLTIVAMSLGTT